MESEPRDMTALRESQDENPTQIQPGRDWPKYRAAMRLGSVPEVADPDSELRWVAFNMSEPTVQLDWSSAPSRIALRWLRELRLKTSLRDSFWSELWPAWMQKRLALTLPGGGKGKGRDLGGDPMSAKVGRKVGEAA